MTRIFILFILLALQTPAFATTVKDEVPYREDAGLTRAEYYLAKEKYTQALDEATRVIKRHPKSADAYVYRGLAYHQMQDTNKAADNFRKALILNPTHLGANKYMADLYLADGQTARAYEQLQVMRMVCGAAACEEVDDLERDINKAKSGKKTKGK